MTTAQAQEELTKAGIKFNRRDYMTGCATFEQYYEQFVTPYVVGAIESNIGRDKILASTDKHFNDIPLGKWDRLQGFVPRRLISLANIPVNPRDDVHYQPNFSISDGTCILKAAARMIKEGRA